MIACDFPTFFHTFWGYDPFPWQEMLAVRTAAGRWPQALDLPTASGKTACIDVAIHVLASQSERPLAERTAIVLTVAGISDSVPFTYEGRAFDRVDNTTRKMTQEHYEALLRERAHNRRRWENREAEELTIKDIDREEAQRIVEPARSTGRLVGPVGRSLPELLDRLGVRRKGKLLRAAVVLFGKTFLPDYPQCELRMARFRGVDKIEFLDQRHLRGSAFKLLEEAELFCQRHFPLLGRIELGRLQRVDRPLIPPDAMRKILVNGRCSETRFNRRSLPPSRSHREVGPRYEPRRRHVPHCGRRAAGLREDRGSGRRDVPGGRCRGRGVARERRGSRWGSHRGSHRGGREAAGCHDRGDETPGNADQPGSQARGALSASLPRPCVERRPHRDDYPRQAHESAAEIPAHGPGSSLARRSKVPVTGIVHRLAHVLTWESSGSCKVPRGGRGPQGGRLARDRRRG